MLDRLQAKGPHESWGVRAGSAPSSGDPGKTRAGPDAPVPVEPSCGPSNSHARTNGADPHPRPGGILAAALRSARRPAGGWPEMDYPSLPPPFLPDDPATTADPGSSAVPRGPLRGPRGRRDALPILGSDLVPPASPKTGLRPRRSRAALRPSTWAPRSLPGRPLRPSVPCSGSRLPLPPRRCPGISLPTNMPHASPCLPRPRRRTGPAQFSPLRAARHPPSAHNHENRPCPWPSPAMERRWPDGSFGDLAPAGLKAKAAARAPGAVDLPEPGSLSGFLAAMSEPFRWPPAAESSPLALARRTALGGG